VCFLANGFVHYVSSDYAKSYVCFMPYPFSDGRRTKSFSQNLTYATTSAAVVKVDTSVGPRSSPDASTGRFSVRLESKTQYSEGLFVFDVKHTPYGCATWPALWLTE
jgi:hypothetical protein